MSEKLIAELRARLGEKVRSDEDALDAHAHDQWVVAILRHMEKRAERAAAVVEVESAEDVAATFEVARAHAVPVVPFGGGSGVCGAAVAPAGAIVLDTKRMNAVLELDETSLTCRAQPGVNGGVFEKWLGERGYTLGHFPQSIDLSTLGGWVSTRASGQLSTKYGNIEDMLLAFEAVLPDGRIVRTRPVPRAANGPDLRALFLGSEGTLGVLTELTFRVHPKAEATWSESFAFADVHEGLEAIREVLRPGWRPAVTRLYDAIEAGRQFAGTAPDGHSMLLVHGEGPQALVDTESSAVRAIVEARGGVAKGSEPVEHWMGHRNQVPSFESFLENGMLVDTIEVASSWATIHALYDGVLERMRAVDGLLVASGHSSHAYSSGTNIYFTFAAKPEDMSGAEDLYERCWTAAMEATLEVGGTISHHHGIGRWRSRWMERELGSAHPLLLDLKRAFDPEGLLNPGALYGDPS